MARTALHRLFDLGAAAALAAVAATLALRPAGIESPETVRLQPAAFTHRLDGEWRRDGREIDAPRASVVIPAAVDIMAYPVSVGDYARCVADGRCAAPMGPAADARLPVTGVSWRDANDYAAWLSDRTGATWRLPTDTEWAQAAGPLFVDDAVGIEDDPANPAARWLAKYEAETRRRNDTDRTLVPVGAFNRNAAGVHDIAGPVWEWTSTCLRRVNVDAAGETLSADESCGIYIAEGRHRAALTEFVRNPKTGGCSVGAAPAHLGFRLVRTGSRGFFALLAL